MQSVQRLFLAAIILVPLNIVERLLFGIDELHGTVSTVALVDIGARLLAGLA